MGDEGTNPLPLRRRMPFTVTGGGGFAIRLRVVTSEDRARIQRAYSLLSDRSRLNRFWSTAKEMNEELAGRLARTNEADHLSWIALDPEDDDFPGFGAASLWIDRAHPTQAEVSLTIADAWQHRGLGTLLFSLLWFEGWELGVRRVFAFGRAGNHEMHAWWTQMGGQVAVVGTGLEMTLDLMPPADLVHQAGFDLHATNSMVDLAGWMQQWLDATSW